MARLKVQTKMEIRNGPMSLKSDPMLNDNYRNLASAVLFLAIKDYRHGDYISDVRYFVQSESCDFYCSIVGVDVNRYRRYMKEIRG